MDLFKQIRHIKPSSVREQQRYRAEKMLMRQFMLMKTQYQAPGYVSTEDMKERLLAGSSFQEEFQEIAKGPKKEKLLAAQVAWTLARVLCVNQMEQELQQELEKEERLSLCGLEERSDWRAFKCFNHVSIIRPKAEQDVQIFLCHLSNKLLNAFAGCHTSSKLALFIKLQWTAAPFAPQVVETALKFLLDEPEPVDEVRTSQSQGAIVSKDSSLSSTLGNRVDSADSQTGKQLAEAAATCFCMDPPCLLHVCTYVARDMVKAIYRRFEDHSKTFHLMDLDESFFTARESAVCAIQDMVDRVQSDAHNWNLYQLHKVKGPMTPEVSCEAAAPQRTDEKKDKEEKQEARGFFGWIRVKMKRVPTKE